MLSFCFTMAWIFEKKPAAEVFFHSERSGHFDVGRLQLRVRVECEVHQ